jgi:hypothetical protein
MPRTHSNNQLDELGQFLFEHVETHEQLQALLWLHKSRAESHSIECISAALHMPASVVSEAVHRLCGSELVRAERSGFRCAPETASLRSSVDQLATAYAENWSAVLQLLSSNAIRRIRTSVMGEFADAFVIKGKKW